MTRHSWVIAAALMSLPAAGAGAGEMRGSVESGLPEAQASRPAAPGFDGFLQIRLAQLAATLNPERKQPGLSFAGTPMETLLGYLASADESSLDARIDRVKRASVGLRYGGGKPERESELELRIPFSGGAALTSGYEASRLDVGLGSTDGDVEHLFKIGASLRF